MCSWEKWLKTWQYVKVLWCRFCLVWLLCLGFHPYMVPHFFLCFFCNFTIRAIGYVFLRTSAILLVALGNQPLPVLGHCQEVGLFGGLRESVRVCVCVLTMLASEDLCTSDGFNHLLSMYL